jgi:1-acyl-sn-glycerol-3-phosphate acyltransferase
MDHRIFKLPLLGWIFRTARAIPIAPAKEDPWLMEKAYVDIAQALHEGDLVCIFPEGQLTRTGDINEFKGGIAKIVERTKVPVIPMALRGLWGHLLSRNRKTCSNALSAAACVRACRWPWACRWRRRTSRRTI